MVAVFEGAEQFHSVERAEIQIGVETRIFAKTSRRTPGDLRNQIGESCFADGCAGAVAAEDFLCGFCNLRATRLLSRGAREIFIRPNHPAPNALVLGKALISTVDDLGPVGFTVS